MRRLIIRADASPSLAQRAFQINRGAKVAKKEKQTSSEKAEFRKKILFELTSDEVLRSEGEKLCKGNSFDALIKRRKFLQKLKEHGIDVPSSKEKLFEN